MEAKRLIGYISLGVISALIVVVVLLSVIPVGKYSLNLDKNATASTEVTSGLYSKPTSQISISKYESSSLYKYNINTTDTGEKAEDFAKILDTFNSLGNYTVMQSLFLGLSGVDTSLQYNSKSTTRFSSLSEKTDGYLVTFIWSDAQTLKNMDGSTYTDSDDKTVTFTELAIFIDDANEVQNYTIYVKTGSSNSSYVKYTYTSYSNVISLYNLVKGFDDAVKFQAYK